MRSRQQSIGRELRRMFDEVVAEPVPDAFLDLLKQIDEKQSEERPAAKGATPEPAHDQAAAAQRAARE